MREIMKILRKLLSIWLLIPILLGSSMGVQAENNNVTVTGRYLTVTNHPQSDQIDLLSQTIQVHFPVSIQTVGEAMHYLLRFSGYSLVAKAQMHDALKITLSQPLPLIDRELGPVSLKKGLLTLAGPAFYLLQDPIHRTVNFHLKERVIKNRKGKQS